MLNFLNNLSVLKNMSDIYIKKVDHKPNIDKFIKLT